MLFSSISFVFAFLPLVLLLYYLFRGTAYRNFVLLAASLLFYAWGEPRYLLILMVSVTITWAAALALTRVRYKKLCLAAALLADLSFLIYFKYTNFLLENINTLLTQPVDPINVVMPIGISFYTFQAISYLMDVYRGEVPVQRSLYKLMLYITLFPQLVAGPIVKYHDICLQINSRQETLDNFTCGARRFIFGLAKKMLIANTLGAVADTIFALPVAQYDGATAWLGIVAYCVQLYFDFSGYSDMAIGLCLMFGFKLPENFNYPFLSCSTTEFWRRWHISLSTWFREYLYFPLGGSRVAPFRLYINLFIVFMATGIWHGASWNFVLWGLWNAVFVMLEKATNWPKIEGGFAFRVFKNVSFMISFLIGLVFFRADTVPYALEFLADMAGCGAKGMWSGSHACYIGPYAAGMLVLGILLSFPLARGWAYVKGVKVSLAMNAWCLVLLVAAWAAMAASTYNPFIYFRF